MKRKLYYLIPAFLILGAAIYIYMKKDDSPKDYKEITRAGVLNIVTDYNSIGYFVSGDTIAGFNYDLIQLLKSHIPLKVEIMLESDLDKSIEGMKHGKYDVLARNIPVTSELREELRFTEYLGGMVIIYL